MVGLRLQTRALVFGADVFVAPPIADGVTTAYGMTFGIGTSDPTALRWAALIGIPLGLVLGGLYLHDLATTFD